MGDESVKNDTGSNNGRSQGSRRRQRSKPEIESENILISLVLNFSISIIEAVGGILSGSMALLADSLHIFGDSITTLLKYFSNKKQSSQHKNFTKASGKRNEIVGALFNAMVLFSIAVFIAIESYKRYLAQVHIHCLIMIVISGMALAANLISLLLFGQEKKNNRKVKSAFNNQLLDSISTTLVLGGAIVMYYYKMYWIDTAITIVVVLFIIKAAITLLNNTVNNLISSPVNQIDEMALKSIILRQEGIVDVHHIHIWNTNEYDLHFDCHIVLAENIMVAEAYEMRKILKKLLVDQYKFRNLTFQFEYKAPQY